MVHLLDQFSIIGAHFVQGQLEGFDGADQSIQLGVGIAGGKVLKLPFGLMIVIGYGFGLLSSSSSWD